MKRFWFSSLLLLIPAAIDAAPPLSDADVTKLHALIRRPPAG